MSDNAEQRRGISEEIQARFVRIARLLGIRGLDFTLNAADKDRLVYASLLPLILFAGILVALAIEVVYGQEQAYGLDRDAVGAWQRIHAVAGVLESITPLVVAGLFIAGIARVSRGVASWSALIACGLLLLAGLLFMGTAVAYGVVNLTYEETEDLHIFKWSFWAYDAAFVAIGYAFLAYRGLSGSTYRPREAVRRRRSAARRDEVVPPDQRANGEEPPL